MAEVNVSRKQEGQGQQESPGLTTREGPHAMRRGWPGMQSRRNAFDIFNTSPLALMRRLNEEMDRAFFSGFGSRGGGDWLPAVDVAERNGELHVCVDLPGVDQNDVKVEVSNGVLTISGERKQESEEESDGFRRFERSYGSFSRSIPLPEGADVEKAHGSFHNGVLEVAIPLPGKQQTSRQIPIQSGNSRKQENYQQSGSGGSREQTPTHTNPARQGAGTADPASPRKQVAAEGQNPTKEQKAG